RPETRYGRSATIQALATLRWILKARTRFTLRLTSGAALLSGSMGAVRKPQSTRPPTAGPAGKNLPKVFLMKTADKRDASDSTSTARIRISFTRLLNTKEAAAIAANNRARQGRKLASTN